MKNFISVSTNAARFQDISLNPQKLAGMCAKLKCCLNYEVDDYMEASRKLPPRDAILQTQDADYYYFKADILAGLVSYSTDKKVPANVETISAERAREIIELNKAGEKPLSLQEEGYVKDDGKPKDLLDDDISRFDKSKKKKKKKKAKPEQDKKAQDRNPEERQAEAIPANRRNNQKKRPPKGGEGQQPPKAKPDNQQNGWADSLPNDTHGRCCSGDGHALGLLFRYRISPLLSHRPRRVGSCRGV